VDAVTAANYQNKDEKPKRQGDRLRHAQTVTACAAKDNPVMPRRSELTEIQNDFKSPFGERLFQTIWEGCAHVASAE